MEQLRHFIQKDNSKNMECRRCGSNLKKQTSLPSQIRASKELGIPLKGTYRCPKCYPNGPIFEEDDDD